MQKYLIPFGLSVSLFALTAYLLTILNPFDEAAISELISSQSIKSSTEFIELIKELIAKGLVTDYLNFKNILIISATGLAAIICLFFVIHLIVDKLFIKKFYEQPSMFNAGRRGVMVALAIAGIVISKVYGGEWYYALIWGALVLVIELLLTRIFHRPVATKEGEVTEEPMTFFQKHTQGLSFDPRSFPKKFKAAVERFNLRRSEADEN